MKILAKWLTLAAVLWAAPVVAHEFWIDPLEFQIAADEAMQADIRVGTELKGAPYSYNPANFKRFDLVMGDKMVPVEGRAGDRPALNMQAADDGLATVVHVTKDYRLTYTDWQKFINFCTHKDFTHVIAEHTARGLPETRFVELYSRHAKSLIAVGDGAGADREIGLEVEIVALGNPYTDDLSEGFPVRVLYQGAPKADAQVEVFARNAKGDVTIELYRTDAEGEAVVVVEDGSFYLVDHVVMRPLDPDAANGAVWESLWASLTFEVPA